MGMGRLFVLAALAFVAVPLERTLAGPDWVEDNDAGHLPPNAQKPQGTGQMSSISGSLAALSVAEGTPDMVDMYVIFITDPQQFSAQTITTAPAVPGFANFDSQIWLFDQHGRGLLANDDALSGQSGSRIVQPATDGTGQGIPGRGTYYLAISAFDTDPFSQNGEALFNQQLRTEISGPDGPGGLSPVRQWGTSALQGSYLIGLTGVAFPPDPVPAASSWGMVVLFCATAIAGTLCARRRMGADAVA